MFQRNFGGDHDGWQAKEEAMVKGGSMFETTWQERPVYDVGRPHRFSRVARPSIHYDLVLEASDT